MSDDKNKQPPMVISQAVRQASGKFPAVIAVPAHRPSDPRQGVVLSTGTRPSGTNLPAVHLSAIDVMTRDGLVTAEQALSVRSLLGTGHRSLDAVLEEIGFTPEQLVDYRMRKYDVPTLELSQILPLPEVLQILSYDKCKKYGVIPVALNAGTLTIAIANPGDYDTIKAIEFATSTKVFRVVVTEAQIERARERLYRGIVDGASRAADEASRAALDKQLQQAAIGGVEVVSDQTDVLDPKSLTESSKDDAIVKIVNALLYNAITAGASDIHIESYEKMFRVRYRIDGTLQEIVRPDIKLRNAIVSRIKIMASLDIAERRAPQDGRIKIRLTGGHDCDFRVSVLPALFGEKVVMRLLDRSNLQTDMSKLGFDDLELKKFMTAIHKPHGIVLVTGPTGSGKTTTLYSALAELNQVAENVSTVEDPVEYNLEGINQFAVKDGSDMTFPNVLRSLLRQDPDVIMVGEIRDFETASIAVQAALTGHMVLSTLHTNDAPATVFRLLNMGIEPYMITASVNLIAAQRLLRRPCQNCKTSFVPDKKACLEAGLSESEFAKATFMKAEGCSSCRGTGYRGRVAVYELMPLTDDLRTAILQGAALEEIKSMSVRNGMQTLRRSALMKFTAGLTTLEEVLKTTAADKS